MIKYIMIKNIDRSILLHYKTMRKCLVCKEYITLEDEWDNIVHYSSNTKSRCGVYHKVCFMNLFDKHKLKDDKNLEKILEDSEFELYNLICKNHLYKWWSEHYEIILIPNYVFTKVEEIFKGNWKDMSKPIPPWHLLDMFIRQKNYLDKIYHKVELNGVSRINYDLAVLIAKYPAYLKFMEQEKQNEIQVINILDAKKIDFSNISKKKEIEQIDLLEEEL